MFPLNIWRGWQERQSRRAVLLRDRASAVFILAKLKRGDDVARLQQEITKIDQELKDLGWL